MEQKLPLLEGDNRRGEVRCRSEGCYITYTVDTPVWDNGVKKVWLCSDAGGRLLLGTLVPEKGRLQLRRRVSLSTLRCCGMGRVDYAAVAPQPPREQWRSMRSFSTKDPVIQQGIASHPNGFWREDDGCIRLRFPWLPGEPVPLVSLFCFALPRDGWWEITLP